MAYQDTPGASKGNAFCWNTWQPRVQWGSVAAQSKGATQTGIVEAKRAQGVDVLHQGGMASAVIHDARYPRHRALPQIRR
jgi:hypothetical protein